VEIALRSDCFKAACADEGRAAALAAIAIGVLIMIWLDAIDRGVANLNPIFSNRPCIPSWRGRDLFSSLMHVSDADS